MPRWKVVGDEYGWLERTRKVLTQHLKMFFRSPCPYKKSFSNVECLLHFPVRIVAV